MSFDNVPKPPAAPIVEFDDKRSGIISRKKYNLILLGLITLGLFVIGLGVLLTTGGTSLIPVASQGMVMIVSFVVSIAGIIIMFVGRSNDNAGITLFGYLMLILSFGVLVSLTLQLYSLGTIIIGLGITTLICIVFTVLGFIFPEFFAKIHRALIVALLIAVIVSIVFIFMGISPVWMDYLIIAIFCGLIAYDVYKAANDTPTYANAIMYAANIYLDIVNILIRVLSILGRK